MSELRGRLVASVCLSLASLVDANATRLDTNTQTDTNDTSARRPFRGRG